MTNDPNTRNKNRLLRRSIPVLALALVAAFAAAPNVAADHSDEEFEEGCAVTPGGWGAPPAGNNPGSVLHDHFDELFPSGFTVGNTHFDDAQEVTDAIPSGDALFNHAVALTINLAFGNAGLLDETLSGVTADSDDFGDFTGLTAEELLDAANEELANPSLSNDERSDLIDAITSLNEEDEGCLPVPPTNLVCIPLETGVNRLTWDFPGDTGDAFNVYRSTDGENFTFIATTTNMTFDDAAVVPETTYFYYVTTLNATTQEESARSGIVSCTAIPFFPGLVAVGAALAGTLAIAGVRRRGRKC